MTNKKMKKAMAMTTVAAMMAATMLTTGCGNFSYSSKTNTDITTVQDSAGNDYEVTHTTKNVNGDKSESYENVPLEIYNETPVKISGVYIATVNSDEWGKNWLFDESKEKELIVTPGRHAYGNSINYTSDDSMFKVKVETVDGKSAEFTNLDISKVEDPEHIALAISAEKGSDEATAAFL